MKIDALKPNILRIAVHQEDKDPNYGSCLWAYFDFDLDRYMLNIQSDCGNAAYRWCATPDSESFLQLMARIDDDYLMYKLFEPEHVVVYATIQGIRDILGIGGDDSHKDEDMLEDEREWLEEAIDDLQEKLAYSSESCEVAKYVVEEWNNYHDLDIDCVYDCVVVDFSAWQKRIVEFFRDYVQPKIREIINLDANVEYLEG